MTSRSHPMWTARNRCDICRSILPAEAILAELPWEYVEAG